MKRIHDLLQRGLSSEDGTAIISILRQVNLWNRIEVRLTLRQASSPAEFNELTVDRFSEQWELSSITDGSGVPRN